MVQELKSNKEKIAVIGAGPAGCMAAYHLQNNFSVTLFDFSSPLRTLLHTGGGRCNLAYAEYDFRELAKNYPRGEKFLYSIFSRFSTADTIDFFEKIGIKTYVQDDLRIFPVSNSAKEVREAFLNNLKNSEFKKEKVLRINPKENAFEVVTDCSSYNFDKIIIAIGGHSSYNLIKYLGHTIEDPRPALVGLKTKENLKELAGVSFKNITAKFNNKILSGDLLFTHEGISGPLTYKISSIMAKEKFPYKISFDFYGDIDLQELLNANPHKNIKNLLSEFIPKSFASFILKKLSVNEDEKSHKIDGKIRDKIIELLNNFEVNIISTAKDGEVVTCGGVSLYEVNPKTLESKIVPGVYFCGGVLDIDGFCGGFNLQNCWSTAQTVCL